MWKGKLSILLLVFMTLPILALAQKKTTHAPDEKAEEEAKKKAEKEYKELIKVFSIKEGHGNQGPTGSMSNNSLAAAFYRMAMNSINLKYILWVKTNAVKIAEGNFDENAIEEMAKTIGKTEGLDAKAMEGLQVLLLQESFQIATKDYYSKLYAYKSTGDLKEKLKNALQFLSTDSLKIDQSALDSIQQLLQLVPGKKEVTAQPQMTDKTSEKTEGFARKTPVPEGNNVGDLSHTKMQLTEKIADLDKEQNEQAKEIYAINQRKKKISGMLTKMSSDVSNSQESVIQKLQN